MARGTLGSAVVTGGAHGIGKAIAARLAGQGFHVVVADIDGDGGTEVAQKIVADGASARFLRADMTSRTDIESMVAEASESEGGLAVLVNNAAITRAIDLFDVTADDWDQIFTLNARGYFLAMQAAARVMRDAGGGSIVNVASIAGKGWKETSNVAYAAAKGAVITMTRIAAARFGEHGIRVNSVCPGMTRTELMDGWLQGRSASEGRSVEDLLAEVSRQVPLRRLNQPDDVAAAVGFLASDAARTITGQSLNVDGGIVWD
jgi:NAD(P)-dependent dehydrogenase (short-subunit alcohol dehydrogenase family)